MFRKNLQPFRVSGGVFYSYHLPGGDVGQTTDPADIINTRLIVEHILDDKRGLRYNLEFVGFHGLPWRADGKDINVGGHLLLRETVQSGRWRSATGVSMGPAGWTVLASKLTPVISGRRLSNILLGDCMQRVRVIFAGALVLLLVIFSFNAYACLLPLFGVQQSAMAGGCADPLDQPVRLFCDTFTTLGLQTTADFHASVDIDTQVVSPAEAAPQTWLMSLFTWTPLLQGYPAQRPPQDALVRTTVLRI